jgi:phage shock protein A
MKRPLHILHHSGEISSELSAFFEKHSITVSPTQNYSDQTEYTHLLISGDQDFAELAETFAVMKSDIFVAALGDVTDWASFVANNGRFVIEPNWLSSPMARVAMQKYFLGQASVHLDENFPSVKEGSSFKVTNHLRVGLGLDKMCAFAHARDTAVVNLRTFVDHALYYMFYLKEAGAAGLPVDVDYGFTGTDMVVQLHLPVKGFVAEYLLDSFGKPVGHDPLKYLLAICVRSANFTEVQYIESAGKLVITGLWQKGLKSSGLSIGKIYTSEQLAREIEREMTLVEAPVEKEIEELKHKPLPENSIQIAIPEPAPIDDAIVVNGDRPQEDEFKQVIGGGEEEPEEVIKVSGSEEQEELVQKISGKTEADLSKIVLSGEKIKPDDFVMRVSQGVGSEAKGSWTVKSNIANNVAPQVIRGRLNTFAQKNGLDVDNLSGEELQRFTKEELPEVLKEFVTVGTSKVAEAPAGTSAKESMLVQKLRTAENENIKLKAQLDAMTSEVRILKEARQKMSEINAKAKESANLAPTVNPQDVLSLEQKMQMMQASQNNPEIAEKMRKLMEREQKIIQAGKDAEGEVRKIKLEVQQKEIFFQQELERVNQGMRTRDVMVQKVKDGMAIITAKKDREIAELKNRVATMITAQTSSQQNNGAQKVKELEQEKQALNRLVEMYKNKISSMAANIEKQNTGANPKKDEELRKVTMDKQRAEVALQTAQRDLAKLKSRGELDQSELQRLRSEKAKLEESLRAAVASAGPTNAATNARSEAQATKIRELQQELTQQTQKAARSEAKVDELEAKITELSASLSKAPSGQPDAAMKSKLAQMEASVKKLSSDFTNATNQLAEAKKEINKVRSENTALKNQVDKAKKDAEKASKKAS